MYQCMDWSCIWHSYAHTHTHTHTYILSLALSKLCRNKEQCNLMMVFCSNGVMNLWYCVPWILWKEMCKYGDLCFSSVGAAGQIEYESPLQVVLYPDPRLRAKNKIINVFDEKLQQLVQEMFDIMYKWVSLLLLSLNSDMSVNPRQDRSCRLLQLSWQLKICYLWLSDTLWMALIMLWLHSLSCYLWIVVVKIYLQFHEYEVVVNLFLWFCFQCTGSQG